MWKGCWEGGSIKLIESASPHCDNGCNCYNYQPNSTLILGFHGPSLGSSSSYDDHEPPHASCNNKNGSDHKKKIHKGKNHRRRYIVKSATSLPTSPYHYSSPKFLKSLLTSIEVGNSFASFNQGELDNRFAEFIKNFVRLFALT